jgi:hypothetical protein
MQNYDQTKKGEMSRNVRCVRQKCTQKCWAENPDGEMTTWKTQVQMGGQY